MDRMAKHTKQPDVLRELFAAVGNDPFLIAECLARPVVAERLVNDVNESAVISSATKRSREIPFTELKRSSEGSFDFAQDDIAANLDNATYKLPEISGGCTDNTWTATATVNAPDGREFYTAVWTGIEMIVFGGLNFTAGRLNTGGRYDPSTDSWISTSLNNAPSPRDYHSAVWTGTEMIVWGGEPILNTGGRYDPSTDSWMAMSTANAPSARDSHTAV